MNDTYLLGIDVGSTTVKIALVRASDGHLLYHDYRRHAAEQRAVSAAMLRDLAARYPDAHVRVACTGSGSRDLAGALDVGYVQEVVAAGVAVRRRRPDARTAIELGGQDAKVVMFHDRAVSDMRMNGSCAGGTGAFIDEIASLVRTPTDEFDALAASGSRVHHISGRCGVFAKTDIQPLLNQGVDRGDIALSTFHAVARQTIGGLAQGVEIGAPVLFLGGPLTFCPTLRGVFAEQLGLTDDECILPAHPEVFVALGAALSVTVLSHDQSPRRLSAIIAEIEELERGHARAVSADFGDSDRRTGAFFQDIAERNAFEQRHARRPFERATFAPGSEVGAYIGVDAGSTTTKIAILDENGALLDSAYSSNRGEPLETGVELLSRLLERYEAEGVRLTVRGLGTTGYGERLFAAALHADYHIVETVAHAVAALREAPDASFVLDIGGQDMKAIFITGGVVTGITLNEACSAGCGSFLESFAAGLGVPVEEIGRRAFQSSRPSRLGSRCTVFMNSSIITEQKNGMAAEDILAGLCRSIVENVFTKVVRLPNMAALGPTVVVQGGTFENDAVLRAMEQFTERRIVRASHPGLMGAIGVALLTQEAQESRASAAGLNAPPRSAFGGVAALEAFTYTTESGVTCEACANRCDRTVVRFSDGGVFVTGNRCERGAEVSSAAGSSARASATGGEKAADLVRERERIFMSPPDIEPVVASVAGRPRTRIGIPRVLEFWHSMPFWRALWRSLDFEVVLSGRSTRALYESGLASVASDTVCFPAKLVHGHVRDLFARSVDRVFMPIINRMPPENESTTSDHVCSVVKGYPLVMEASDAAVRGSGVPFDRPIFHWTDARTRRLQIERWLASTFGAAPAAISQALDNADRAQRAAEELLRRRGAEVLRDLEARGGFGVVVAGRPYHTDPLVNHDVANAFTERGIPVLTADSLPGLEDVDLSRTRPELTNNFHVRMFSAALLAARHPNLELVQLVSFGCGHDAVISDEVVRLMEEGGGKTPLTLKLDESEAGGPLAIRIRSFLETVDARRRRTASADADDRRSADGAAFAEPEHAKPPNAPRELPDPYGVKYTRAHRRERVIYAPNVSPAFAQVISAAIRAEGYRVEPLPPADRRAFELGKRYVHGDMCFPAQVNVGELLRALETGYADPRTAVCGLAKDQCDCRLAHYASLARRALDDAGYQDIPIITSDRDTKDMHPGFTLSPLFQLRMLYALAITDAMERLRLRVRPYELRRGQVDEVFESGVKRVSAAVEQSVPRAVRAFRDIAAEFAAIPRREEARRPRVFVIGEFLLNFHPTANFDVVRYMEKNGMEVAMPNILDSFRRDYMRMQTERRDFGVRYPFAERVLQDVTDRLMDHVINKIDRIATTDPWFEPRATLPEIARVSEHIVPHTFTSGEGWMIAGEILHHAEQGVRSFLILQPFGCLPNHVTGRGIVRRLKDAYPDARILSIDYDPDTSFASVENRLQMLIMSARADIAPRTELSDGLPKTTPTP